MAFAGAYHGVGVTVVAPEGTLPEKRRAMEMLGATVIVAGANLTEAEDHARDVARRDGALYIEDGESPHLMVGAASVALEMLDATPGLDVILVPVGGGNLIAATLLAVSARESSATVIGVQSSAAPGATMSWMEGEIVRRASSTYAGGLATERPGELSLRVMMRLLPTMILVTDDDLVRVTGEAFRTLGLVVEGAAAAPLAALSLHPDVIDGRQVGVVVTGSWLSADQLTASLA
jgi:threonine dehydratase